MKPKVLLLPLECQDHQSCNKSYKQLLCTNSRDLSQFSVTIKFEPKNFHNAEVQSVSRKSTNQIISDSNSTSITVGVVHIKVEPQDENEVNRSGNAESHSGNSHRSHVIDSQKSDITRDNAIACAKDMLDTEVNFTNSSDSKGMSQDRNNVSCDMCSAKFNTKQLLSRHLRTCLTTLEGDASTRGKYSRHCKNTKKSPRKETIYKCPTCDKSFNRIGHYNRHKRIHTGEKLFLCSTCGKSFSQLGDCKRHQLTNEGVKPYECPTCGKSFSCCANCKRHQRLHTGKKLYKCPTCGKSFSQLGHFKSHQHTHTGEKPYKCPTCGKSFSQLGDCKRHQLTHEGVKPYECPTCGKSFSCCANCKTHQRIHTGEKPYKCPTSGKSFSQLGHFKGHQHTHTGEKPYKCPTCGKSFSLLGVFKRHQRIHTSEKP